MLRLRRLFLLSAAPDSAVISSRTRLWDREPERVTITTRTTVLTDETGSSTTDIIITTDYDNNPLNSTVIYDPSYVFAGDAGPNDTDDGDLY